jgi:D-glycero-D-manno-heptose 1,7-bisphosphate phosphatase
MSVRLLFLDRDGTLNRTVRDRAPNRPEEVALLRGVETVLSRYAADGWQLVIVSNQGGVAYGYLTEAQARAVQQRVIDLLPVPVAASYLCPHVSGAPQPEFDLDCPNRKPRPGFLHTALRALGARPENCLFVGDAITDQQAADAAGVPFRWADRFFRRPIRRGLHTRDGRWVNLREATATDAGSLLALIRRVVAGDITPALRTVQHRLETARAAPNRRGVHSQSDLGSGQDRLLAQELGATGDRNDLYLLATMRATVAGWLTLLRNDALGDRQSANLTFGVDRECRDLDIDSLLMQAGLEWTRWQPGLERVCVEVSRADVPVTRLCCRFGFAEEEGRNSANQDRATLICDR